MKKQVFLTAETVQAHNKNSSEETKKRRVPETLLRFIRFPYVSGYFLLFYAHGSEASGMRISDRSICSHKNHSPVEAFSLSLTGRGESAPEDFR